MNVKFFNDPPSLVLLAVSSLTEHAQFMSSLRCSELPVVESVLELCWILWSGAEEHLRTKELEEQSLYKFRSKTHLIQESEGEVSERQLKEMFPSYEEPLEEEMSGSMDTMEEDERGREGELETDVVRDSAIVKFSVEDLQHVASLHLLLYGEKVDWSVRTPDVRQLSYEISSYLTNSLQNIPGITVKPYHFDC